MQLYFPSLNQVGKGILLITKRFPFVILSSVVGTIGAVLFLELSAHTDTIPSDFLKLWLIGGLGISFLLALTLLLEPFGWDPLAKRSIEGLGVLLLIGYYIALGPQVDMLPVEAWYRFAVFVLAAHLFVSFAPYIKRGNLNQFWEFNKILFLRFLLSALYSGVLFVGLSIALVSVSELLGFEVAEQRYLQLFVCLGGLFNTWFFLAGVPDKQAIMSNTLSFSAGLRRFTQYVLIPLVTVYIVILYLYLGKILVQWELPNGWVANLILTFSIAGILTLLLLYPIRDSDESPWVRVYSGYYYLALLPLIGLLLLSIYVRISEYGVTVNRYYVAALGVWLTGMVIYFILSRTKTIKIIPISLCVVAIGVNVGPLGAIEVSERSQLNRFVNILDEYGYLNSQGKVQKGETEIPWAARKELSSIVDYIIETHGITSINKVLKEPVESNSEDSLTHSRSHLMPSSQQVFAHLGIGYVNTWERQQLPIGNEHQELFTYSFQTDVIDVKDYAWLLDDVVIINRHVERETIENFTLYFDADTEALTITNPELGLNERLNLKPGLEQLLAEARHTTTPVPKEYATIQLKDDVWNIVLVLERFSGSIINDSLRITEINTKILLKKNQ